MPAFVREALVQEGLMEAYKAPPPYQRNHYQSMIPTNPEASRENQRI